MGHGLLTLLKLASIFFCSRVGFAIDLYGSNLPHDAVLDPYGKYRVSWDFDDDKIIFQLEVETLGFIGFGLSPNGDMKDSDIIIAGVNDVNSTAYLSDRYALGQTQPVIDDSSDWVMLKGSQNGTHTQIRFWRKLDTCDKQDRRITTDTARVIWAYHTDDWDKAQLENNGYHGTNRGSKSIILLNPQKELPEIPGDSYTVDFLNRNATIPDDDTTYWCEAFSTHTFTQKEHIIKIEPVIQSGHEQLVHHIVLYSCAMTIANDTAGQMGICFSGEMPPEWVQCFTTIFAWAVGGSPFFFPEHVGYPLGDDDSSRLILLQTHYDNPGRRADFVDSSGLRLTIARRLRQYDAGTIAAGLVPIKSHFIPPNAENFQSDGHCLPECLAQAMENVTELNVFATFPHAHLLGTAIRLRHIRNGRELPPITVDNNYDFNYQETRLLESEVKVRNTDHLVTECIYNSLHKTNITYGGESTSEEMCITFILYYPRIALANCNSYVDPKTIGDFAGVTFFPNFTVNEPASLHGRGMKDILHNNIDWLDKRKTDEIQEMIKSYDNPVRVVCSSDTFYPISFELRKPPKIEEPYVEPDVCIDKVVTTTMTSSALARTAYIYVIIMTTIFLFI